MRRLLPFSQDEVRELGRFAAAMDRLYAPYRYRLVSEGEAQALPVLRVRGPDDAEELWTIAVTFAKVGDDARRPRLWRRRRAEYFAVFDKPGRRVCYQATGHLHRLLHGIGAAAPVGRDAAGMSLSALLGLEPLEAGTGLPDPERAAAA